MKHLAFSTLFRPLCVAVLTVAASSLFFACDKDTADLYPTVEQAHKVPSPIVAISQKDIELPKSSEKSKVLVIDFTGQYCKFCPAVMKYLKEVRDENETMKENVFIVSMHPWSRYSGSIQSDDAEEYADYFNISGLPSVISNYQDFGRYPDLKQLVNNRPKAVSGLELARVGVNEVKATYKARAVEGEELPQEARAMFWLIEKEIVGNQYDGSVFLRAYEHHNVFRTNMNGRHGEAYELGKVLETRLPLVPAGNRHGGQPINIENCMVYAVLLDKDAKKVLSVASMDVPALPTGIRRITK